MLHAPKIFVGPQQLNQINSELLSQPLHRSQAGIAFAAFDGLRVNAMEAEFVGEVLLADVLGFPMPTEVATEGLLQVAFHASNCIRMLLIDLQTYK